MAHDQLQTIDLVIIGAYLIALVLIGVHFMKKVKTSVITILPVVPLVPLL